jgi:hypothetical protein
MGDATFTIDSSLDGLSKDSWLGAVAQIAEEDGFFQDLGKKHHAILVERGTTLLVSFETVSGLRALSAYGQPLGWDMVRNDGWSSLCIASHGDTWFRDPAIYAFFDRLIDDGFFDEFENVIFYGAGPGGYAAAAYSVACPGARVIAIQPQATLDPRVTEWDDRFKEMFRTDFETRFGYAPDMLDAAEQAFVIYDPKVTLDAMHASLFTRPNVVKLRMRRMGIALQSSLLQLDQLETVLKLAADGDLTPLSFAKLYRARRDNRKYLQKLLSVLEAEDRKGLILLLCRFVTSRMQAPRFVRKKKLIEAEMRLLAATEEDTGEIEDFEVEDVDQDDDDAPLGRSKNAP